MNDFITIPGVACGTCGSTELRCIAPGDEPDCHDLIGLLSRGTPTRGWCSLECQFGIPTQNAAGAPSAASLTQHGGSAAEHTRTIS